MAKVTATWLILLVCTALSAYRHSGVSAGLARRARGVSICLLFDLSEALVIWVNAILWAFLLFIVLRLLRVFDMRSHGR